ncbi:MAG: sugar phosphate isomerase/epimerase family protein [Bacteroidota bacterium]
MNQLTIFSWFGFSIPMEERFKLIKSAGFDGVLLWWSDEYAAVDGDKRLHPEMARRHGLFIENIHTPIFRNNCLWEDCLEGETVANILIDCINDCQKFNIPTAVIHLIHGNTPPSYNQIGLDRIKRLVEVAERKGVNLALENLRQPGVLDYLFSKIQSDRLGFCYDSGHENCYTKGTDFLSQYGSKLMALHLHDNDGSDDQHWIPGEGSIDWKALLKKLKATGYSGPIAFEVENESPRYSSNKNPELFLRRAFQAGKSLL